MKTPKNPLSKEAHKHFSDKLKRGERFHSKEERKKMIKRLNMYDKGFRKDKETEIERGR